MRISLAAAAALWVAALCAVGVAASDGDQYECLGSSDAMAALQSNDNITVQHMEGVGYAFVISPALVISLAIPGYAGGPNLTRGVVIFPEDDVAPEAYAPLARGRYHNEHLLLSIERLSIMQVSRGYHTGFA